MHEWLDGLQKSAVRTSVGVGQEDVQRVETEYGVPLPGDLTALFRAFNGGDFQGEVTLFALHGPEGAPSVLEKTRLMVEGLPAAGLWRIGLKGPHRHLFAARKSALREQAEGSLPGWSEPLSDDEWIYGTWDTDARELRMYRSLQGMLEVLVPPPEKDVEEFGDRTYARALSAVQGALNDLSEEYEGGESAQAEADKDEADEDEDETATDEIEAEEAEAEAEADEDETDDAEAELTDEEEGGISDEKLRQPVVAAARRRMDKLQNQSAEASAEPPSPAARKRAKTPAREDAESARKAEVSPPARPSAVKKAPALKSATKKAAPAKKNAAPAKKGAAQKAPARKTATKKGAAQKAPPRKTATKKAPAKKAPAKKAPAKKGAAQKAPARKTATKKGAAQKAPAKKAPAKKGAAQKARSAGRGRR